MTSEDRVIAAKEQPPTIPPVPLQSFFAKLVGGDARAGIWLAAILIVTAIVYSRSFDNDFMYDERPLIVNNQYIGNWSFTWKSLANDELYLLDPLHQAQSSHFRAQNLYYRPMVSLWMALNFHLFGSHPAGWHAATISLHLFVVWLVFCITSLLAADLWTALLAAALFALMPLHAESVVATFALPLCVAFELGSFEFYLRRNASPVCDGRRTRWLAFSLVLFGGAMLTYEIAATVPVLIAVHAFILGPNWHARPRRPLAERAYDALAVVWPYALEVAAYMALRHWALMAVSGRTKPFLPPNMMEHLLLDAALLALNLPRVLAIFLIMLVVPWYAGPTHRIDFFGSDAVWSVTAPGFYLPLAGLAMFCGLVFFLLRGHPRRRLYCFCAAWIVITFAPVLSLLVFWVDSLFQDRYLYLPSFGLCVMAADLAIVFARDSERKAKAVWVGAAVALVAYAVLLFSVQRFWHDDVALFSYYVEKRPNDSNAHFQLGYALQEHGDLANARQEIQTTISLEPQAGPNRFATLARVDERLGDHAAAARVLAQWVKSLEHPAAGAYAELALAADAAGDTKGSEAALTEAAALPGGAQTAATADAQIRFRHGDRKRAEEILNELLHRHPDNAEALDVLGAVLLAEQNYGEAVQAYRREVSVLPNAPGLHYKLALALHQMGSDHEARDTCSIALTEAPNDPKATALMAAIEAALRVPSR